MARQMNWFHSAAPSSLGVCWEKSCPGEAIEKDECRIEPEKHKSRCNPGELPRTSKQEKAKPQFDSIEGDEKLVPLRE